MTAIEAILFGISILLLGWIGVVLTFLRHRLAKSRKLAAFGLAVGPAIYAAVLLALLGKGAAYSLVWLPLAPLLGGLVALLRSQGTSLSFDRSAGAWLVSTSPLALVSIATIALVQPLGLTARLIAGAAFDETSFHVWVAVFLLSISTVYALMMAIRMRLAAKAQPA
jgi:hypothetical protein